MLTEFIECERGKVSNPECLKIKLRQHKSTSTSKYPNRNWGMCRCLNQTHDPMREKQMPKLLGHQILRKYRSVTNVNN